MLRDRLAAFNEVVSISLACVIYIFLLPPPFSFSLALCIYPHIHCYILYSLHSSKAELTLCPWYSYRTFIFRTVILHIRIDALFSSIILFNIIIFIIFRNFLFFPSLFITDPAKYRILIRVIIFRVRFIFV